MPRRLEHSVLSFRSPLLEMKGVGNDGLPGIAHAHVVILQTNTIYPPKILGRATAPLLTTM
jgi:hypothetical protein